MHMQTRKGSAARAAEGAGLSIKKAFKTVVRL